jgi:hypothetical protein
LKSGHISIVPATCKESGISQLRIRFISFELCTR